MRGCENRTGAEGKEQRVRNNDIGEASEQKERIRKRTAGERRERERMQRRKRSRQLETLVAVWIY